MPHYTYGCLHCAHLFDIEHGMKETPLIICPSCGGLTEKKPHASTTILHHPSPNDKNPIETYHASQSCALHHPHWQATDACDHHD